MALLPIFGVICKFLGGSDLGAARGACRAAAPPPLSLPEQLLLWTSRAFATKNAAEKLAKDVALLVDFGHIMEHRIEMRRRREYETLSDLDSDEESYACWVCGRVAGAQGSYNLEDGRVMCHPCLQEEEVPPAIDSFF